jgi:hypothetical protein
MPNKKLSKQNIHKLNEILIFVAIETDLRPSEMRQLVYVDADTILNKFTVRHPQTQKTYEIQCDSSHGWMVEFLANAWNRDKIDFYADMCDFE